MNILITGAGSVMGQSIYKALSFCRYSGGLGIHFANSEPVNAGRYFSLPNAPVVAAPQFPLAVDPAYSDFLSNYVAKHQIDVVFPGTQHELHKIALLRDQKLKAATLPFAIVDLCTDKVATYQKLTLYGIDVPLTQSLRCYSDDNDTIKGPIIIKPNHSSSSRSIYKFSTRDEALASVQRLNLNPQKFVVQQMLFGEEHTCGCYVDKFNRTLSHIVFKRTLTPDGATSYGEIVREPRISRYLSDIAQALIKEGLDYGHFNVQLILSTNGPKLFEINGRLSSTEASKAHYGFNSCAAFVANIALNTSYDDFCIANHGRFMRYYEEVYFD